MFAGDRVAMAVEVAAREAQLQGVRPCGNSAFTAVREQNIPIQTNTIGCNVVAGEDDGGLGGIIWSLAGRASDKGQGLPLGMKLLTVGGKRVWTHEVCGKRSPPNNRRERLLPLLSRTPHLLRSKGEMQWLRSEMGSQ